MDDPSPSRVPAPDPPPADAGDPPQREPTAAQHQAAESTEVAGALARIARTLRSAEQVADIGVAVPSFGYLGTIRRAIAYASGRFLLYLLRLITVDQRRFNRLLLDASDDLCRTVARMNSALEAVGAEQGGLAAGVEALAAQVDVLSARTDALAARTEPLVGRVESIESVIGPFGWHINELTTAMTDRDGRVASLERLIEEERQALAEVREMTAYLRRRIGERDTRLDALLAEVGLAEVASRPAAPAPAVDAAAVPRVESTGSIDDVGFQESFRGDEAELRDAQRRYLPFFAGRANVLDLGCGRGEFLEILREAGVSARGVDCNAASVLHCREKGLDVVQADALEHLAGLPDGSLGGIFCAQVIEHLPANAAVRLIQLAHAKLQPGAPLLVETLNPECLLVHYRWFWMDLTHVRLMHPETLKFLFLSSGFHRLEGQYSPAREPAPLLPPLALPTESVAKRDAFNAATAHLNALLHASPDYALIGYR